MRWFKHYSGALQSESLADLLRDTGLQGYARYWILLEHLAGIFDGESDSFRVPIETIRRLFRVRSWNELETFCERLSTIRGLNLKRIGNVFEIKAPILLELQDKDFKRSRMLRDDTAPKIKIKNKIKDIDKDIDKELQKIKIEQIYLDLYPLKKGKTKGVEKLSKEIKTDVDLENLKIAINNYSKTISDPKYIKHFSTFASEWRDWLEQSAGMSTLQKNNPSNVFDHARDQLERIERGEL